MLRLRAVRERRGVANARLGERAVEFLAPVRDVARGPVTIHELRGALAEVGDLMEHAVGNVRGLSLRQNFALVADAHLDRALQYEIHFLLRLVVPRRLAALRVERDEAHREMLSLYRRRAAHDVLGEATRGVAAPGGRVEVGDNHKNPFMSKRT